MPRNVPNFVDLLRGCKESAVHLELRDTYNVTSERARIAAWRAGNDPSRTDPELRRDWLDMVRETVGRGVLMRRARVVSEPLSEYMRFSHAGTQLNIDAGEQVRWLSRGKATDLTLPENDFWLYDGRLVKVHHFTRDGESVSHELTEDPAVVALCASAFEAVWERATPHAEYVI